MSPHDEFPPAWKAALVVAYIAVMGAMSWAAHEWLGPQYLKPLIDGLPNWLAVVLLALLLGVTVPSCIRDVRNHWREKRWQADEAAGITVLPPPPRPRLP